ncbi:MAG: hypothetical protein KBC87_02880 [Candidatus Pacebacteria bacterium]|nr:hypothetical protein [Candidatus Paceibacterota bacterium]
MKMPKERNKMTKKIFFRFLRYITEKPSFAWYLITAIAAAIVITDIARNGWLK